MDQAPVGADRGIGEKPLDGPRAGLGEAVVDLLRLLGDVDVDGAAGTGGGEVRELLRGDGAERMGGDADAVLRAGDEGVAALHQPGIAVEVVQEPALAGAGGGGAEAAVGIEDRQVGEGDAGRLRGGGDPARHLAEVGVGLAVGVVVEVVELADAGIARLQHLHEGEGRQCLRLFGRKGEGEAVHHLAPGPEAVPPRPALLGQPGEAALERMAMEVREAGEQDVDLGVAGTGGGIGGDGGDPVACHRQAQVAGPALGQQRGLGVDVHGSSVPPELGLCKAGRFMYILI